MRVVPSSHTFVFFATLSCLVTVYAVSSFHNDIDIMSFFEHMNTTNSLLMSHNKHSK